MIASAKKDERENIEVVASMKEDAYNDYIESIKGIVDSKKDSEQVEVAKLSDEALLKVFKNDKIYKETKEGDEHLDKLIDEATKNLNSSLHFLLSKSISKKNYEEIRLFADSPIYVSKENIALFKKETEKMDKYLAKEREEQRKATVKVKTGDSKKDVETLLGSPIKVTKNNEAEFWTYDGAVLTMKNGYVFDITYSLE